MRFPVRPPRGETSRTDEMDEKIFLALGTNAVWSEAHARPDVASLPFSLFFSSHFRLFLASPSARLTFTSQASGHIPSSHILYPQQSPSESSGTSAQRKRTFLLTLGLSALTSSWSQLQDGQVYLTPPDLNFTDEFRDSIRRLAEAVNSSSSSGRGRSRGRGGARDRGHWRGGGGRGGFSHTRDTGRGGFGYQSGPPRSAEPRQHLSPSEIPAPSSAYLEVTMKESDTVTPD